MTQGPSVPNAHVCPEAPATGVRPCQYGDMCLKWREHLRVRGCVRCRCGGGNVSAGTGGILEYRQGGSANAAPRPNPAPIAVLLRSVMPGGGPSPWRPRGKGLSCVQGACTGEANQFCKLFQQALLGQPRFTVTLLWSGRISVKLHLLQGCISFSFAFPSYGGVGGCVHFLLVLLAVHLPGTKTSLRLAEMNEYFQNMASKH